MTRHPATMFVIACVLFFPLACNAQDRQGDWEARQFDTEYQQISVERIVEDLEHPWSLAFLPEGGKLITERPGRLLFVEEGEKTRITGLPDILARGQGGLLEVSLHPQYADNGWIYLTYSKPNDEGNTALALVRGRIEGEHLADTEELFVQNRYSRPGRHYGSRIAWLGDGTLLVSIGDRGPDPLRAQDAGDHAGSVLRLHEDGSVPDDNPFVEDEEVLDEIYSYGSRNIQGLLVDPETDDIWATEHGPRGGDLLHLIEPGKNYGWPVVTRGRDYGTQEQFPHADARRMEGIAEPVYDFGPTHPPSGLAMVTTGRFNRWNGNLLAGGLLSERIRRLVIGTYDGQYEVVHDEELLLGALGRIRDVREGPDGNIYVLTDHADGALYRIDPVR